MVYAFLLSVMSEAGMTPEEFGEKLGVRGMTIRRWQKRPPDEEMPRKYETALIDAMHRLVTEGRLSPESPSVKQALRDNANLSIAAALAHLGVTLEDLRADDAKPEALIELLTRIGRDEARRTQVHHSTRTLAYFQRLGRLWKERIALLTQVLADEGRALTEKLVAYGALFYLITPFDLIPDHVPVVGLLDDYAVLMLAVAYYTELTAA